MKLAEANNCRVANNRRDAADDIVRKRQLTHRLDLLSVPTEFWFRWCGNAIYGADAHYEPVAGNHFIGGMTGPPFVLRWAAKQFAANGSG